jgi:hypothetical protein
MSPSARQLQRLAAVGSAAVMAVGVIAFDWPTFTVLAFYWLENVIVGGFTALRLLAAGARTGRYLQSLVTTVFFSVHYGLFCLVHGVFVATLFGGIHTTMGGIADPVLLMVGRVAGDRIGLLVVLAMVVAAALDAWRAAATLDADDAKAIRAIMTEPYGRIVVLHLVLIGGGFLMVALQLPSLAALLLVAFKLAYDLGRLRRGGAASAQPAGQLPPA